MTVEDPIEYQLEGISQMQVASKKGMTFVNSLRHILRQDPDVIMVGEVRDEETAAMAIQSSLTGHLVFSTLHTNDAAGAISDCWISGLNRTWSAPPWSVCWPSGWCGRSVRTAGRNMCPRPMNCGSWASGRYPKIQFFMLAAAAGNALIPAIAAGPVFMS